MQARYTHKWTSAIDDDDVYSAVFADWQEELAGLTDKQIINGIKNLPRGGWPPTSAEFRDLCENKSEKWEHNTKAYRVIDRSHRIELKADKELARQELDKARELLKG